MGAAAFLGFGEENMPNELDAFAGGAFFLTTGALAEGVAGLGAAAFLGFGEENIPNGLDALAGGGFFSTTGALAGGGVAGLGADPPNKLNVADPFRGFFSATGLLTTGAGVGSFGAGLGDAVPLPKNELSASVMAFGAISISAFGCDFFGGIFSSTGGAAAFGLG